MSAIMFGGPQPATSGIWARLPFQSNGILMYAVYTILIGIIICVVLLTIDFFYPFLPGNPLTGPSAMARAGSKFWGGSDAAQNLIVPAEDAPTKLPAVWSASFQFTLQDSRVPQKNGYYRHILHRGSNPFNISATRPGPSGHAGLQLTDIQGDTDQSYRQNGLPTIMCPGVMLDPYKNDLHIFMHTRAADSGLLLLESATIEDVPLETPITIGLICNQKVLEIYINCRLYDTLLLKGSPHDPPTMGNWYGRYGAFPAQGKINGLTLWSGPLVIRDYMMVCTVGAPSDTSAGPSCPTASEAQLSA